MIKGAIAKLKARRTRWRINHWSIRIPETAMIWADNGEPYLSDRISSHDFGPTLSEMPAYPDDPELVTESIRAEAT